MRGWDNVQAVPWLLLTAPTQVYSDRQWQARRNEEKHAAWWRNCQFNAADKASAAQTVVNVWDSDRSKEASNCVSGKWKRHPHHQRLWLVKAHIHIKGRLNWEGPWWDSWFENNSLGKRHSYRNVTIKEVGSRTKQCHLPGTGTGLPGRHGRFLQTIQKAAEARQCMGRS